MGKVVYKNLGELVQEARRKYGFKDSKHYQKRRNYPMDHPNSHVSSTGFYSVTKTERCNYKQGFCYNYIYYIDGKRCQYTSVDILKLKKKVLSNNKKWGIIDEKKAMDVASYHNIPIEDLS